MDQIYEGVINVSHKNAEYLDIGRCSFALNCIRVVITVDNRVIPVVDACDMIASP